MKKNLIADYAAYTLFKVLGPLLRFLPVSSSLFIGKFGGELLYRFDARHKALVFAQIKRAIGKGLSTCQIQRIVRRFYHNLGQNFIEILLTPLVDRAFIKKYMTVDGQENIDAALKRGKGVLFLTLHAGSWEFANITSANLGFTLNVFVRDQKFPKLNALLNYYREQFGCKVISRGNETRQLFEVLKKNEGVGITVDQGGKDGMSVPFFGKEASMSTGAVRIALKHGAAIAPSFYVRLRGVGHKIIVKPAITLTSTGNREADIRSNLQALMGIYEELIREYPWEYLWTYKIWKYGKKKDIVILSDAKTGHLRQSQALSEIVALCYREKGIEVSVTTIFVEYLSRKARLRVLLAALCAGKYRCQGVLESLRECFGKESYSAMAAAVPDMVISCGSSLSAVNYLFSKEFAAQSVVIMKPLLLGAGRFDAVIMPQHDYPPKRKNVVSIAGALNLIDDAYLVSQSLQLRASLPAEYIPSEMTIGVLIGGDTKEFQLSERGLRTIARQLKIAAKNFSADILLTTSRRTSVESERILKEELQGDPHTKLFVIARERNPPATVGGILGLSSVVVTTPESISMISEAVASGKYCLVFKAPGLSGKHKSFIDTLSEGGFIRLIEEENLASAIDALWRAKPAVKRLTDNAKVKELIRKII